MAETRQRGTKGKRDTQTGKLTITRKWLVDGLSEVLTVGDDTLLGLPEIDRDFAEQIEGKGRYEVTITYGGIDSQGSPGRKQGKEGGLWSGRITIREEPIETAPNFEKLLKEWEGTLDDNGKVIWPVNLSKARTGTGLGGRQTSSKKNPMYGVSTFPAIGGEVEHSYMVKDEPPDLLERVGKVIAQLPNGGPKTPKNYLWVTLCPEFEPHGTAWHIRDKYQLVHKDNYLSVVYQVIRR